MLEKIKNTLKKLFSAEYIDIVCTVLLFALTLGSAVLVSLGYYLDAICGFLTVIAIATISTYLDYKKINTLYGQYLKTWLEKNGNR